MATPTQNDPAATPALPLSPQVRAAYQALYDKIQSELDNTMDPVAIEALNAVQPQIDDILTKDDLLKMHENTEVFTALQGQIADANRALKILKGQIAATASHFALAGDIVSAVDKVLTLAPAL